MMYGNKLAAAIKVDGKVLREFKDTVHIPFGSEYAITIKNLHTTRAVVSVYIDGDNMVPGGLVLNAGQSIDLERSIRNNNLTEGNKFKFIERTGRIENHRGIRIEDGLVRIEYQFELPVVVPQWDSIMRGIDRGWITASGATYSSVSPTSASLNSINASAQSFNDAGITVPGSKSTQSFTTTHVGAMDPTTHNLVFKLFGGTMPKPITVKHKPKCQTCGKQNKATAKFCTECGTALEIFA
jgi:hypothetical protein